MTKYGIYLKTKSFFRKVKVGYKKKVKGVIQNHIKTVWGNKENEKGRKGKKREIRIKN